MTIGSRSDDEDRPQVVAARHRARPGAGAGRTGGVGQHEPAERAEEIAGVVGPGGRLRVVLHREGRGRQRAEPLDHAVVEVDVRRLGVGDGPGRHGVVVVLARDLDDAGLEALHGMVGPVVPEGQLVGRPAERRGQDLVTEADAEDRHTPDEVGHGGGRARQGGGVARAVGEEHAVGLERQHVVGRRAGRHHGDRAERGEQLHHGRLDAEVVRHDPQAAGRAVARPPMHARVARRDTRHQVQAVGAEGGGRGGAQLGFGSRAEGARDRTGPADMARQSPGVDAGQRRNAVAAQEGLEGLGGAPVRRLAGQVADHDPPAVRGAGLVVGGVRAVVPDVGAGEGDHLARVGRVRDHLLVAAHGGVEHELARGHGQRGAGRLAAEDAAVRRHQQRRRPVTLAGRRRFGHCRAHRCAAASITTASPRSTV